MRRYLPGSGSQATVTGFIPGFRRSPFPTVEDGAAGSIESETETVSLRGKPKPLGRSEMGGLEGSRRIASTVVALPRSMVSTEAWSARSCPSDIQPMFP